MIALIVIAGSVAAYNSSPFVRYSRQIKLGNSYLDNGQYEEAVAAFQVAMQIDPADDTVKDALASTYRAWSKSDAKALNFDSALNRLNDAAKVLNEIDFTTDIEQLYVEWAESCLNQDDPDNAVKVLSDAQTALGSRPSSFDDVYTAIEQAYIEQVRSFLSKGDTDKARKVLDDAEKLLGYKPLSFDAIYSEIDRKENQQHQEELKTELQKLQNNAIILSFGEMREMSELLAVWTSMPIRSADWSMTYHGEDDYSYSLSTKQQFINNKLVNEKCQYSTGNSYSEAYTYNSDGLYSHLIRSDSISGQPITADSKVNNDNQIVYYSLVVPEEDLQIFYMPMEDIVYNDGNIVSLTEYSDDDLGAKLTFSYRDDGRLGSVLYEPQSQYSSTNRPVTYNFSYDNNGHLILVSGSGSDVAGSYEYSWNEGYLKSMKGNELDIYGGTANYVATYK